MGLYVALGIIGWMLSPLIAMKAMDEYGNDGKRRDIPLYEFQEECIRDGLITQEDMDRAREEAIRKGYSTVDDCESARKDYESKMVKARNHSLDEYVKREKIFWIFNK